MNYELKKNKKNREEEEVSRGDAEARREDRNYLTVKNKTENRENEDGGI
jgi:hypothetical protein